MAETVSEAVRDAIDAAAASHELVRCARHDEYYPAEIQAGGKTMPGRCPRCVLAENEERAKQEHVARQRRQEEERAKQRREETERRLERSLIPTRYRDYSIDTFPEPAGLRAQDADDLRSVISACRSYVNTWLQQRKAGAGMVLVGANGRGKTGLACGMANAIMRDYHATALFMSARGVVRHLADTWGRKGKTEQQALDELIAVDLLIVDEVGVQVGSELEMVLFFEVLNGRYAERRPTILISNLPVEDYRPTGTDTVRQGLKRFLGSRLWSRIEDDGTQVLACRWPTLRAQARA